MSRRIGNLMTSLAEPVKLYLPPVQIARILKAKSASQAFQRGDIEPISRLQREQFQRREAERTMPITSTVGRVIGSFAPFGIGMAAQRAALPGLGRAISRLPFAARLAARGAEMVPTAAALSGVERASLAERQGVPTTIEDVAKAALTSALVSIPLGAGAEALGTAGRAIQQRAFRQTIQGITQAFVDKNPHATPGQTEQFISSLSRQMAEKGWTLEGGMSMVKSMRILGRLRQGRVDIPTIPEAAPAKPAPTTAPERGIVPPVPPQPQPAPITPPVVAKSKVSKPPASLLGVVRAKGGLDPLKVGKDYNIREDFQQFGLLSVLKKGGGNLDEMASSLQEEGYLQVPENRQSGEYLLEVLKDKQKRLIKTVEQLEKEFNQEYAQLQQEESHAGADALTSAEIAAVERNAQEEAQSDLAQEGVELAPDALEFDPAKLETGIPSETSVLDLDPQEQQSLLKSARLGTGKFEPGEVYAQTVPPGVDRPVIIHRVLPDGSLEGYYLGAPFKAEAVMGIPPASLIPGRWKPSELKMVTSQAPPVQQQLPGTEPALPSGKIQPPQLIQEGAGLLFEGQPQAPLPTPPAAPETPLDKKNREFIEQRRQRRIARGGKYAIDEEGYNAITSGQPEDLPPRPGQKAKEIPPTTATNTPMAFPTQGGTETGGRHIEDIYEREIGPVLQLSTRMRRWLGVYYGGKGRGSGLIRVKSLENQQVLAHETGHFLDDVMGETMTLSPRSPERKELIAVTQHLRPFDEKRVPMLDKGGNPILTKKGVPRTRQSSYTAYRRSREELFADYVSLYIADAAKAKALAPTFTARVDAEIARDTEFAYIVKKMREYDAAFKPLKDFVAGLRAIPQIDPLLKPWEERGVLLENVWRDVIGNRLWLIVNRRVKRFGKTFLGRQLTEQRGLDDTVFTILTQRRKLIDGQTLRVQEVLIEPISQLSKDDQEWMSAALERFETVDPSNPLSALTEDARRELAVWGNEARRLGLLNDFTFWDNVGQYFPYFYETKEFAANKAKFGTTFLTKALRANLSSYKHRLTDEQMGQKALEDRYTTFPSGLAKIAAISQEEKIALGKKIRQEMGLMRTTAYPLKIRIGRMIQSVYTTKALNAIADMPGMVGTKQSAGYVRLPEGNSLGNLSGQWVPENIAREINAFSQTVSEIGKVVDVVNGIWKAFKVPYDPSAVVRNPVTNLASMWMFADVPVWNPNVIGRGVSSFVSRDTAYQLLRDHGLYKHTYSQVELQGLAFVMESEPETMFEAIVKWAAKTFQTPGQFYGAVEDASKTIVARYVLDQGGTPAQAVQLADKALFDYSQVSHVVAGARRTLWPFVTWSAKVFPRLVEVAVRKPEKFAFFYALLATIGAMSRLALGLSRQEEEDLKPQWAKGPRHALLLLPGRDANGEVNWINLDYFLPWGGWLNTVKESLIGVPQPLQAGGPFVILYNAWVQNYDPFIGSIARKRAGPEEQAKSRMEYLRQGLLPDILGGRGTENLIAAAKQEPDYLGRTPSIGREVLKETLGVSVIAGGETTTKARNLIDELTQRRTDINRKAREAVVAFAEQPTMARRLERDRALQEVLPESRKQLQRDAEQAVRFKHNPLVLSLMRATSNEQKVAILQGARFRFASKGDYQQFLNEMRRAKVISFEVVQQARRR